MHSNVPFQTTTIPAGLTERIEEAIASNRLSGAALKLERDVAAYVGKQYALATSNSTAALHLAMCALDLKRGDKVLCPINAFADLPEVVRHFDAEPVFVDVLPESYAVDPASVRKAAEKIKGKKLRAVLVSHPGGHPAPMQALQEVARAYDLKIIEDATEMMGSPVAGVFSDMAVFGLGSKTDNIIDGGLLLSDHAAYNERARLLRNHGLVYPAEEIPYLYDILDIGCQYRMQDFAAIYCQELFAHHEESTRRRRAIAARYREALSGLDNLSMPKDHPDHLYAQFIIQVATNRDAFARKLRAEGIEVGVPYIPLNLTQYYKEKYALKVFDFPVALDAYQKMMALPIYPSMSDEEVDRVCRAVADVAKDHR
jgi:dTDP-4-amino-4,6-dideoxygalactose transaminase